MDVGLRELRQRASELVRRAQAGEVVTVTVSGRVAARLVAAERHQWRHFPDIAELFGGPEDADWGRDRRLLNDTPRDPWAGE
ncbi:MAG TPA: type II toxin-antitoxin system prevent-host-death family antitoxin [Mycobacteriales bacterium]|nr:type II toxin-antitoxin system prevent-host-death family antitoxin [Mycobacteriales bacterium]